MAPTNSVFSQAFSAIRRRPLTLWFAAAWPYLILALVYASITVSIKVNQSSGPQISLMERYNAMGYGEKLAMIFAFIASIFVPADLAASAVSFLIWTEHQGHESTLRAYFLRLAKTIFPLLALSMSLGTVAFFASFAFGIPGLLLAAWTAFVIPTLIIGDVSTSKPFRKALRRASDTFGTLLSIYFVIAIFLTLVLVVSMFVKVQADDQNWQVSLVSFWIIFVIAFSGGMMIRSALVACLLMRAQFSSQPPSTEQV